VTLTMFLPWCCIRCNGTSLVVLGDVIHNPVAIEAFIDLSP